MISRHTPSVRLQRLSALVIERCRVCLKHESLDQPNIPAALRLLPVSVVKQISLAAFITSKLPPQLQLNLSEYGPSAKTGSAYIYSEVTDHYINAVDGLTHVWLHTHARLHM